MKVVGAIDGISFVYFDDRDVVRHKLVQQIVKAYEAFTMGSAARPSSSLRPVETLGAAKVERPPSGADVARGEPVEPRA